MGLKSSDIPPQGLPSFLEPIRCLGEGGMGAVWSVRDRRTGEIGALKAIRATLLTDRAIVRRFEREMRTIARLNHPGIVQVLDVGRLSSNAPYLLMEQVDGVPLIDLEITGRELGELIRLFDRILAALAYAHARRIIHRDLKPDNVLVVTDELGELHPKLMDFGLAMVAVRGQLSATRLTADGMVVGTPAYMAPEQACDEHHKIGPASDLYAFGCMLYELLTGAPPHIASSPMALLLAHATKPPRPFSPLPTLPSARKLEPLVMRLLAKDPLERFECAADVRVELRRSGLLEASDVVDSEPLGPWGDTLLDIAPAKDPSDEDQAGDANFISGNLWFDAPASAPSPGLSKLTQPQLAEKPAEAMLQVSVLNLREPPFVGRAGPRNTLHRYIEDVRDAGQTAVCLVSGPTGIGKGRIVSWIAYEGEARGALRYLRISLASGSSVSICMLQAISDHLRLRGLSRAHALQALKRFFRTSDADDWRVAGLLDVVTARGGRMVSSTMSRLELLIYAAIEQLAIGRPLMLWLDETHGVPPAQIAAFIRGLCIRQEKRPSPILAVVVDRAETDMPSDLELAIGKIEEAWLRPGIHLQPLSSAEVYELTRHGLNLTDELARHVVQLSEGLALLAVALARQWHAAGLLKRTARGFEHRGNITELPVPEAVQSVFTNQLELAFEGLEEDVWRPVAELAAVLGDTFKGTWLSDGLPSLPSHANALRADFFLERTQSAGLLRPLPGEGNNFSFSNTLMREGLLASIPTERLADLHRAAAQAKSSTLDNTASSQIEIAQHLLAGRAYDQAYDKFVSAARGLVAHARFDEAVGVLEAAHQSLANSAGVSGPWDGRVATVWELEHEIAIARYDIETARERAAWLQHAASRLADTVWDARVKRALGMVQQRNGSLENALILLKESETLLRATDTNDDTKRELGKTLLARAECELALDNGIEIGPIAFEAVTLARNQEDPRLLARALAFSGCSALLREELAEDELERAREQLEEALEHSREAGDLRTEAAVVDSLADIHLHIGDLETAEKLLHQASRCYEALGDFEVTAEVHRRLAELARSQGRQQDAVAHERWIKLLGA